MMGGYGYGYGPMMGGGGTWLGWLLMLGFWLLILAGFVMLIVWMVRGGSRRHMMMGGPMHMQGSGDEALEIARRRLASGEITTEQFEQIRKTLTGS